MPDRSLPVEPHKLLDAAMRLASELDRAQLYTAAALAAMAADAISDALRGTGVARQRPFRTRRYFN